MQILTDEHVDLLRLMSASEAHCATLRSKIELLRFKLAELAAQYHSLGGPWKLEPRADFNPGGPANPQGHAWLRDAKAHALLGQSVPWDFADRLWNLLTEVDDLNRVAQAM